MRNYGYKEAFLIICYMDEEFKLNAAQHLKDFSKSISYHMLYRHRVLTECGPVFEIFFKIVKFLTNFDISIKKGLSKKKTVN